MIAGNSVNRRRRAVKRKRNRTNPYFPEMGPISSVLNAVLRRIGFSAPRCSFFRSRRQISSRIRRGREFMLQWGAIAQLVPAIGANSAPKFGALIRTQFRSELQPPRFSPEPPFCTLGGGWLVSLHFAVSLSAKETFYRDFCLEFSSFL